MNLFSQEVQSTGYVDLVSHLVYREAPGDPRRLVLHEVCDTAPAVATRLPPMTVDRTLLETLRNLPAVLGRVATVPLAPTHVQGLQAPQRSDRSYRAATALWACEGEPDVPATLERGFSLERIFYPGMTLVAVVFKRIEIDLPTIPRRCVDAASWSALQVLASHLPPAEAVLQLVPPLVAPQPPDVAAA